MGTRRTCGNTRTGHTSRPCGTACAAWPPALSRWSPGPRQQPCHHPAQSWRIKHGPGSRNGMWDRFRASSMRQMQEINLGQMQDINLGQGRYPARQWNGTAQWWRPSGRRWWRGQGPSDHRRARTRPAAGVGRRKRHVRHRCQMQLQEVTSQARGGKYCGCTTCAELSACRCQPEHITRHGIPSTTQLSLAVDLQLPIPSPGAPKQAQAGFPRPPAAHALR